MTWQRAKGAIGFEHLEDVVQIIGKPGGVRIYEMA
jgi:hypothetical protein